MRKESHLLGLQTDDARGDELIAVAPNSGISGRHADVVERSSFVAGPEQRGPIAQIAGACGNQPDQQRNTSRACSGKKVKPVIGYQVSRLRLAGYCECVCCKQLKERIIAFLLAVIEGEEPLLEFR